MANAIHTANRLANEQSPYLLQHAHNPVDWWPWCEEAFARAKQEDRPVFLSIGYSSCHWCHVMEREVFEAQEAARLLNDRFVCIKVDREERPDVDHLYMEACMTLTGSGGWPLSLFLTPDKRAFYAKTYLPLDAFLSLAGSIAQHWVDGRNGLTGAAEQVERALGRHSAPGNWPDDLPHRAFAALAGSYDDRRGGFGRAPKFPSAHTLMFLQRYGMLHKNRESVAMGRHTLRQMALGGLHDQVGGGFFRYSTDANYLIPHFEKMLYDNAMLAIAYGEYGDMATARRTLGFCMRELASPEGAFYTALDADSEGSEGQYYVFAQGEIEEILGQDAQRYSQLYGISATGNFEGKNLPNLLSTGDLSETDQPFAQHCNDELLACRSKRVRPMRDEKILLSSNSLMLAALSTCGRLLEDAGLLDAAAALADFLTTQMQKDGRYYASYRGSLGHHPATSEDYAYLAWGLLRLHQATLEDRWLTECCLICDQLLVRFADADGLLWMSGHDVTDLPLRTKNTYDGALPSGNAIAAGVLLRLHLLTGEDRYQKAFHAIQKALANQVQAHPAAYTALLSSAMLEQGGLKADIPLRMTSVIKQYHPFATFRVHHDWQQAMVCTADTCLPPVNDQDSLEELLNGNENKP